MWRRQQRLRSGRETEGEQERAEAKEGERREDGERPTATKWEQTAHKRTQKTPRPPSWEPAKVLNLDLKSGLSSEM